jgi:hypothetical protein
MALSIIGQMNSGQQVSVIGCTEILIMLYVHFNFFKINYRLIRKVGHKLKEIGALTNPIRAEKNRDVIEGAHTLLLTKDYNCI